MCIDICPVGALTSGTYRYKTRPWEMEHVGTICTHCGDGCKTTLGARNDKIIRGNNRDRSGINGEFLCVKGRYALRFLRSSGPSAIAADARQRQAGAGLLVEGAGGGGGEVQGSEGRGGKFGVIGSNHTTNEENFYLRKFAREVLGTENIDHHQTGDYPLMLAAADAPLATTADLYNAKAVLVIGADLALAASVPLFPDPRQLPASPGARLRGHAGARARG